MDLNKKADVRVSWDPNDPKASYWSTVNPLSFLTGGVDKVPAWWMDKFTNKQVLGKLTGKEIGHLAFKAGAVGLLTAGIVGGVRTALGLDDLIHGKGSVVDASTKGKLSTTFDPSIYELDQYGNRKKKKLQIKQAGEKSIESDSLMDLSTYNQLGFAIPAAATALAAYLAYTISDEAVAGARRVMNQQQLSDRTEDLNALMIQRARMAKGNLSKLPDFPKPYTKTAGGKDEEAAEPDEPQTDRSWGITNIFKAIGKAFNPTGNNGAAWGALKYAALLATGLGTYMYISKNNENNMKYKAYKAALQEYVKGKTNITPLVVAPANSEEVFETIDTPDTADAVADITAKKPARKQPQFYSDDLNTPISINI